MQHLDEHSDSLGFVDLLDPPLITADRRHYLIRLPMPTEHGTYKQIAMVTINVSSSNLAGFRYGFGIPNIGNFRFENSIRHEL